MAGTKPFVKLFHTLLGNRLAMVQELAEVYKPTINRNREKLMELIKEKAAHARKSKLAQKIKTAKGFYTLEMAPPNAGEIAQIKADLALLKEFFQTGCYKFITVKQAWLLFLIGTEIGLWFFLGETIGKMHIVGYKV